MSFSDEKVIGQVIEVPNDDILPNRFQPRKYFDEMETLELADSIKEHGVLQPIVVRQVGDKYEIVAGERRFKANILAGNDSIPVIINDLDDKKSSEIAIIENIQRQDLTPIEEAISYKRIIDMGYLTQEQLARKIGKSQSAVANKIRLLKLSDNVQDALMGKKISERHARSLLKIESLKKQDELLEKIIKERLTVRKTDEEIRKMNNELINNQNVMMNQQGDNQIGSNQILSNNNLLDPTPMNSQQNTQNIFDNVNENNQNTIEPEIEETNVSPIMGSPINQISNFDLQSLTSINNEQKQDDNVAQMSTNNNQNLSNTNNNISGINGENQISNQDVMSNPVSQNNELYNNTISDSNSPINNGYNIFNNTPIESTPLNQVNNNNINNSNNQEENVDNVMNQTTSINNNPIIDSDINQINESVSSMINTNSVSEPIISEPTNNSFTQPIETNQDQLLQSSPIDQFSLNNETINNVTNNYQQSNGQVDPVSQENINVQNNELNVDTIPDVVPSPVSEMTPLQSQFEINNSDNNINSVEQPIQNVNTPIIVSNDDNQFDPIMPEQNNHQPTLDFKTIINLVRQCSQTIEKCGYRIDTEEIDMGDKYQVTFTIDK